MFVDLKKLPDKAIENLKSEIECAIVRAEADENISMYRKFKDDLDEVELEMKMRQ